MHTIQDEANLYDAAKRGNVSAVRALTATHVNVDCTPYEVCVLYHVHRVYLLLALLQSLYRAN